MAFTAGRGRGAGPRGGASGPGGGPGPQGGAGPGRGHGAGRGRGRGGGAAGLVSGSQKRARLNLRLMRVQLIKFMELNTLTGICNFNNKKLTKKNTEAN